jgi:hypothetical protein
MDNIPVVNWKFLQEPAWRWALFFIMVALFMGAWREVLRHMG